MSDLPAYTPAGVAPSPPPVKGSMAGSIQTCGIEDRQHDYFRITQDSPNHYQISLTVDPTPLYRVEISQDPSAVADIQLFTAFSTNTAEAACRITPKSGKGYKSGPVATTCTFLPVSETAVWRPLSKSSSMTYRENYAGSLPLVMVPGCRPVWRNFSWRFGQDATNNEAAVELWLKDQLPYPPHESIDRGQLFAQYFVRSTRLYEKGVLEIRRGGKLQFEFGVVVGMLAVLELAQREQRK
jgi:hypothetical protein